MNEAQFSTKVKTFFRQTTKTDLSTWVWSFESALVPSVPDLHFVNRAGKTWWVELKVVNTTAEKVPFKKGQPQWLVAYRKLGGQAYVMIYVRKTKTIVLIDAIHSYKLQHKGSIEDFRGDWLGDFDVSRTGHGWFQLNQCLNDCVNKNR